MSSDSHVDAQAVTPFEGPEKLLEIWFAPSPSQVSHIRNKDGKTGLRTIPRQTWEDMLQIVKCKVLSVIEGTELDAYLLSESSLFVSPHCLILKTCGTTLNLLGLPRILEIAANDVSLTTVYRFFYSRKCFLFPERQKGPHKDWKQEVEYLEHFFKNGAAYTVGKVNGDHWLLYLVSTEDPVDHPVSSDLQTPAPEEDDDRLVDYTIEILMSELSPKAGQSFFFLEQSSEAANPSLRGLDVSERVGIASLFPPALTNLDAYTFAPCGYSCNALIKWDDELLDCDAMNPNGHTNGIQKDRVHDVKPLLANEGYYTIHVTPEQGWSYASFECNIPLSTSSNVTRDGKLPNLKTLITHVVNIFEPGRISLTLFISSEHNDTIGKDESPVEAAQRVFKAALTSNSKDSGLHRVYRRTDKINYEFGSYDLAFASFEAK